MMPHFHLPRLSAVAIAVAFAALLGACGQKGPLFLPGKPEAAGTPAKPAAAPAATPSPATPVSQ